MNERKKLYLFIGLIVVLALVYFYNRNNGVVLVGSSGSLQYQPLKVQDPTLRLDLLAHARSLEYSGTHRNIFVAAPPPPSPAVLKAREEAKRRMVGPQPPPPPPPLTIPATFFGYATNPRSGARRAFFTNGEDVYVVAQGGMLLNRYLLLKIDNNSAELEETASGRHATVNLNPAAAPAGYTR
jgi:hypothetical protein